MSWFGMGGGNKKEEEPLPSSYSDSSFDTEPSQSYAPAISSTGGTSVNDIIMEEQQKVLIQQAIAKITAIAWDKCSASKPDSSLSSSEVSCMQNVASSYLDANSYITFRMPLWRRKRHDVTSRPLPPVQSTSVNNNSPDEITSNSSIHEDGRTYRHLLTYPGLVNDHTTGLHHGNFIARSAERWANRHNRAQDNLVAKIKIETSAAIVMQSIVRMWLAKIKKKAAIETHLELQRDRATWISHLNIPLETAWKAINNMDPKQNSLSSIFPLTTSLTSQSAVYTLAATCIKCQLYFRSAVRRARYVRQPQPLRQFVAQAVYQTCSLLHKLRKRVQYNAALTIQCKTRSRYAMHRRRYLEKIRHRHRAASIIQCAFRCYIARCTLAYKRLYRAALMIQCAFRCHVARRIAYLKIFAFVARIVRRQVYEIAIPSASAKIRHEAAKIIQRVQRGRAARSRFRQLSLKNEAVRFARTPLRGYLLYANGDFYGAALQLEQSFLQGWDGDEEYWIKFGTAQFYVYEASGDRNNLEKALGAFRRLLPKSYDLERKEKAWLGMSLLYAKGLFYSRLFKPCLDIALTFLEWSKTLEKCDMEWIATAHVLAAMIYFDQHDFENCCEHLQASIQLLPLKTFTELELRYMLGTALMLLSRERDVDIPQPTMSFIPEAQLISQESKDNDVASTTLPLSASGQPEKDEIATAASQTQPNLPIQESSTPQCTTPFISESSRLAALAEDEFTKCFSIVELWPNMGFYHGVLSAASAENILESTPSGTFLLHRLKNTSKHYIIRVKWNEKEYTVMKVLKNDNGFYSNPNIPEATDRTIFGYLSKLPQAAGINLRHGLRKIKKSIGTSHMDSVSFGADITSVDEWKVSNHAWLHTAHLWDLHSGYVFAAFLASCSPAAVGIRTELSKAGKKAKKISNGWNKKKESSSVISKLSSIVIEQGEAILIQAKAARGMGQLKDSLVLIQQAVELSPAASECVRRSWMARNNDSPFGNAFRKTQKLDRMWNRALALDTYSPFTYGRSTDEVLLLECIFRESFYRFPTVDIHRRLLRAHIRSYCLDGFDLTHLQLAYRSMDALVNATQLQSELTSSIGIPVPRHIDPSIPKPKRKDRSKKRVSRLDVRSWSTETLFEMAEVSYRSLEINRTIEILQLLTKKTATTAYSHMHQISLLRLTFLFAHVGQFDRALHEINQLVHYLERQSICGSVLRWPVTLAFNFTLKEVLFLRGVVRDMHAETDPLNASKFQGKAWQDFNPLHAELVEQVQAMLRDERIFAESSEYRENHISGVIVTVGESHGLMIQNIIRSNLRVVIKCEGKSMATSETPSWETMEPNWNMQKVIIPATSKNATIVLQIVNKVQLRDVVLGTFQIPLSNLFATGSMDGRNFHLRGPDGSIHTQSATIFAAFQLTTFNPIMEREVKEKRQIAFSLSDFLNQSFVWQKFATHFVDMYDHFLARHFLLQALRRLPPPHDKRTIQMMLDLARCDLACRKGLKHESSAMEWIQKAHVAAMMLEPRQQTLENKVLDIMQQAMLQESNFERRLKNAVEHPLVHDYIVIESEHGKYYVDKDTGDCVLDAPLGYEQEIQKAPIRRMVVFSDSMKKRILHLRKKMKEDAEKDLDQWVAMFDDFHGRMFYVSKKHSMQSYTKPELYVMMGDEMTVYSVLVIQDVFRLRRKKAWLRLVFRRCVRVVALVLYMMKQWQKREIARAIRARKVPLTCLKLTVESATGLRAADRVLSDPYVEISVPGCKPRRTTIQKATLNPQWNETFHLKYSWLDHEQTCQSHEKQDQHETIDDDDDDDDYDEQDLLATGQVDLLRVSSQLAKNLVMNEDHGISKEEEKDGPTLTLTVYDYDEPSSANKEPVPDFLGLAVIPIDPLDHGKCITAELQLRDEDGYMSPRSRGTLEITIQWIPYSFPLSLKTLMVATRAMVRLDTLKRLLYLERAKFQVPPRKPKPNMNDDLLMLLELINSKWQEALIKLADAIVMADQLQRLSIRLTEAKKSHKNAEEEEHIERRLQAVIKAQFPVKRQDVERTMSDLTKVIRSFGKVTYADVWGYVESGCDKVLQEKVQLWYSGIGYTPTIDGQEIESNSQRTSDNVDTFSRIMQYVLDQKERFVNWETNIRNIVEICFDGGSWSFDMSKELAICRKIEETLLEIPVERPQLTPFEEEKLKQRQQIRAKKLQKQKKK